MSAEGLDNGATIQRTAAETARVRWTIHGDQARRAENASDAVPSAAACMVFWSSLQARTVFFTGQLTTVMARVTAGR